MIRSFARSLFSKSPKRLTFSIPYAQQVAGLDVACGQNSDSILNWPNMVGSEIPTNISANLFEICAQGRSPFVSYLIELSQGHVYSWQATVCDSKNNILIDVSDALTPKESRWNTLQHSITTKQDLPFAQKLSGELVVVSSPYANNYYHWLFDTLPRLEAEVCNGDRPLFVHQYRSFQRDSLEILGVAKARIVAAEKFPHLYADMLLVPSLPFPPLPAPPSVWRLPVVSSEACGFLQSKLLPSAKARFGSEWNGSLQRKIFIQRRGARSIWNESMLNQLLLDNGFQLVTMEDLTFGEQIRLFCHADVVVGVHGAGLANIVFCRPGTRVVELMPSAWAMPCYWSVSHHVGLDYHLLNVTSVPVPGSPANASSKVLVDLDRLREVLV
jgi:capsular polysaccharide biosynthesis protein